MPEKSSKRSAVFETGKREEAWSAKWVSCSSEEKRHPYFEKKIIPVKEVAKARLYICGLGLYEVFVDEKRVGNEYLTPYSNDYNEWVQYQTYDVTEEFSSEEHSVYCLATAGIRRGLVSVRLRIKAFTEMTGS